MPGRAWQPHQSTQFARQLTLGQSYYFVYKIAQNLAPYEDPQLYSEVTFTKRLPFTGNPCTDTGFSAETLCRQFGPVYDRPPKGVRNIADAGPQVAAPLPEGYEAILDEAEIRGIQKRTSQITDPRTRRIRGRHV